MYQCFHYLQNSLVWQSDFKDFGYDGEGIVHILIFSNCNSEVECRVPLNKGEID